MLKAAKAASDFNTQLGSARELSNLIKSARRWHRHKIQWSVSIKSSDKLYDLAHTWFTDLTSFSDTPPRALEAVYKSIQAHHEYTPPVKFLYDEQRSRTVSIDGHRIRVAIVKEKLNDDLPTKLTDEVPGLSTETIIFYGKTREAQKAVTNMLNDLALRRDIKPRLRIVSNWGDWTNRDDLPERDINSVVLREGQMERISTDIDEFLDTEVEYNKLGMPWHRGYLLHGPPGTGKTSVVRALAASKGLDLWYISLGDIDKDSKLISLISSVTPRSILLLEDIDIFQAARDRQDGTGKASLAALLNGLDGVATPHGMITFMTTNNVDVLDEALIRPGRIDLVEEIGLPDEFQIRNLYSNFYGKDIPEDFTFVKSEPTSFYTEIFQRCMRKPEEALELIRGTGS